MQQQKLAGDLQHGVATFPRIQASVGDMMNVADRLMYFAKNRAKTGLFRKFLSGARKGKTRLAKAANQKCVTNRADDDPIS
ncbi:MAG: hypothetical protein R2874_00090 [Desulfobacterales bacterium]